MSPSSPWYFEEFLAQYWKDGNRCGRHLFHDVKQRGYTGSFSNLERLLGAWRRAEKPAIDKPPANTPDLGPVRDPDTGHAISPVVAAVLCIKPRGLLTAQQARKVHALKRGSRAFVTMRSLSMRFNGILRGGKSEPLDGWIETSMQSTTQSSCPGSNGQVEGQVNRLKTLKRSMYGRAGPELRRARMLPLRHTD